LSKSFAVTANAANHRFSLLAYLQLFRAPNVFTALADIAMGFLFVASAPSSFAPLLGLLASSALLYTAGMVLNDVYDFDIDARERPQRPLPSGRISRAAAHRLGYGLLAAGVLFGWIAGVVSDAAALPWRSGVVATILAGCVTFYDAWAKRTPLGPLAMGSCRFLNILLGMSAAPSIVADHALAAGYDAAQLLTAGGIGLYIVGVTWFARTEAQAKSRTLHLLAATCVMIAGVVLLAVYPAAPSAPPLKFAEMDLLGGLPTQSVWGLLLVLIALPIVARCLAAAADPIPQRVQMAVKRAILSLIVLDAAVTLAVAGPSWGLAVLALLLPTSLLAAWVYST
jgi:4-hydroxybenzoate polyprenyltransferase